MKVIYQSQNKLALQFCPWFKWMFVLVFNICAVLILFALLTITWYTFECDRNLALPTQGHCTLTHHNWISERKRGWQLEQIKGVNLETDGFQKNGSPRYRIDLATTEGIIKLPIAESIYPEQSPQMVEEMRQFLEGQRSSFTRQQDERSHAFFCFMFCLAAAGLFGILGEKVTLEISWYAQRLTLRRQNWMVTRTTEYPLDQILEVKVQKQRGGKFGLMGRIAIVLKNGKTIVVHPYDRFDTEGSAHESAAQICHFLGL